MNILALIVSASLLLAAAWSLARALPAQNIALILGVLIVCEGAFESFGPGQGPSWRHVLFWTAALVLARAGWRWILRSWRQDWNYGGWLIVLSSASVALAQLAEALAGEPWAAAVKRSAIRFATSALCLLFLTPWFISKLPQQPQDHAQ